MGRKIRGSAFHFGKTFDVDGVRAADFYAWLQAHHGHIGNIDTGNIFGHPIVAQCVESMRGHVLFGEMTQ